MKGLLNCTANPLTINFTPAKLSPARVRNTHMELIFLNHLPIFSCIDTLRLIVLRTIQFNN